MVDESRVVFQVEEMVLTIRHSPEVCLFYDCQWSLQCPAIRVEGQSEAKQLMRKWNCTSAGHYGL